jgi:hypothetical protein
MNTETDFYWDPNFYGTQGYHKFSILTKMLATDGVMDFVKKYEAFWTLDVVSSYRSKIDPTHLYDAVFILQREKNGCDFYLRDGDLQVKVHQYIPYIDLTVDLKYYVQKDIIFMPSEY